MADYSTPEERTEMPTERRLDQLRKEGQIHLSTDVAVAVSMVSGFLIVSMMAHSLIYDLKLILIRAFQMIGSRDELSIQALRGGFVALIGLIGPDLAVIVGVIAVMASLAVMTMTGWNVKEKKLHFQFRFLNPINGLKRIFSISGVVNTLKAIAKLLLIIPIGYFGLKECAPEMLKLVHLDTGKVMIFTGERMATLFWKIVYVLIALAIFDYFWGRFQWLKVNKMTKAEVKDERKAVEGDEETKRKIQQKGLARISQRIRATVPKADVVVTNPTHYAVALKYDRATMKAPAVVAKGKGFLALKIREIARESGVPVLERKLLARALYGSTEVGSEIPYDLFKAVAEVLAYVYRLKNKLLTPSAAQPQG